jgi:hypothetical protein
MAEKGTIVSTKDSVWLTDESATSIQRSTRNKAAPDEKGNVWHKTWWGLLLAIIFWFISIPWFVWTKTNLKPAWKTAITALIALLFIAPNFSSGNVNSGIAETELSSRQASVEIDKAERDRKAAENLDAQIMEFGDLREISLEDATRIKNVRNSYNAMPDEQRKLVKNVVILQQAEEIITSLQAAADERIAAEKIEAERIAAEIAEAKRIETEQAAAAEAQRIAAEQAQQPIGQTVFITNTGKKYHRDGCQYLSKSKIQTTLDSAISSGYEP